jgi:hypothetical protein
VSIRTLLRFAIVFLTAGCSHGGPEVLAQAPTLVTYDVGARPRSIAVADLNGDGRLDVIVANSGDNALTLLLGATDGTFELVQSAIPAGNEPADVDAVDIDNDGDVDLVVANHETSLISVLLNDGTAHFASTPDSPIQTGSRPHLHGIATGDFDGDGWKDVAVESSGTNEVRVLRGRRRQQGFSEVLSIPAGTMPYFRLGAADVTNDGHVDVIIPGHGDNTVRVVHLQGDTLKMAIWTIPLASQPWMVVGDDVSGDGRADITVVLTNAVGVWLGDSGTFSPAPGSPWVIAGATEVATGDVDGDGVADIAVGPWDGNEVTIITGRTFKVKTVRTCDRPIGLAIADLNSDGRGELLAACATENRLVVLRWVNGR